MASIGIDLGTTNSCAAVFRGHGPEVIINADGARTTPSAVAIAEDGAHLVGAAALRSRVTRPGETVTSSKRLIGRRADEVGTTHGVIPVTEEGGAARLRIGDTDWAPEQVAALILRRIVDDAEQMLGEPVTDAVITVPAYFNDAQRQATRDAGRIAGLDVKRIINEPTAAALAYGLHGDEGKNVMIVDLGGGTFDVSLLDIRDGVYEVKATAGDNRLGGDDFDEVILRRLQDHQREAQCTDACVDEPQVRARILEAAEQAKRELSVMLETTVSLPFLCADTDGPHHLSMKITRAAFEGWAHDLLTRLEAPIRQVMDDAAITPDDLDAVILVGGMTRMPAVRERVRMITGTEPLASVNPDEVVAMGAAVQAHVLDGGEHDVLLLDVTPLSLGVETRGGLFTRLISRNQTIPARHSEVFTTGEDNQTSVEIHILQGERELAADNRTLGRLQLLDIAPQPRGVPQIEVTFALDADGILEVGATDLVSGQEQALRLDGRGGLADLDLHAMIAEAEQHRAEDAKRARLVEMRNRADGLIYRAEQALALRGEDLGAAERRELLDAITRLRDDLHTEDASVLARHSTALARAAAALFPASGV